MVRLFDFIFSLLGLIFGFPILLIIYVLGLFDTGSPLFKQERVGRYKKPFTLVKFRTMTVDTASVASHLASTASITRMGGFLRKTKLDELPQLWNVFTGEMSVVGPRPIVREEIPLYGDQFEIYTHVHPGLTGLWQVSGRNALSYEKRIALDVRYSQTASIGIDLRIIGITLFEVFRGSGR